MPHDMYPKLAAKWGTLMYFCSAFIDLIIKKPGISESTKVIMSLIFPNLATTRACFNLVVFEFNPNGSGLGWNETLTGKIGGYRVITYFPVLLFALVIQILSRFYNPNIVIFFDFKRTPFHPDSYDRRIEKSHVTASGV